MSGGAWLQLQALTGPGSYFSLHSRASFSSGLPAVSAPSVPFRHPKDTAHIPSGGTYGLNDLAFAVPTLRS